MPSLAYFPPERQSAVTAGRSPGGSSLTIRLRLWLSPIWRDPPIVRAVSDARAKTQGEAHVQATFPRSAVGPPDHVFPGGSSLDDDVRRYSPSGRAPSARV